ncbi:MAG: hypothetical protein Tsb009_08300 [Planctomycetaceae bacterium]
MAVEWYYKSQGQEQGPVPFDTISEMAQTGRLDPADEVRDSKSMNWMRADSIVGLFPEPEELTSLDELDFSFEEASTPNTSPSVKSVSDAADGWFYQSLGQELGPMPFEELCGLAESGALTSDDLVRDGATKDWVPARSNRILGRLIQSAEQSASEVPAPTTRDSASSDSAVKEDTGPSPQVHSASESNDVSSYEDVEPPPPPKHQETSKNASPQNPYHAGERISYREHELQSKSVTATAPPSALTTPAPKPPKPAKVKKFKGPREPLLEKLNLGENKGLVMGLGGIVLFIVIVFIVGITFSGNNHEQQYATLNEIYQEHVALRNRKASDSEWNDLMARAEELKKTMPDELVKAGAGAKNRAAQELLFAVRDKLVDMLKDSRRKPSKKEKEFKAHLELARKLIDNPNYEKEQLQQQASQSEETLSAPDSKSE